MRQHFTLAGLKEKAECLRKTYDEKKYENLQKEEDGTRIFAYDVLSTSEESIAGSFVMTFPILSSKLAEKFHLVYEVEVPYIAKIPYDEVLDYEEENDMNNSAIIHREGDSYHFHVPLDVVDQISDIVAFCNEGSDEKEKSKPVSSKDEQHPSGCIDGEYWLYGRRFEEDEILFVPFESDYVVKEDGNKKYNPNSVNIDASDKVEGIYSPFNVSGYLNKVVDLDDERMSFNEKVFQTMKEYADKKDEPGMCIAFLNGKIMIPVVSFHNIVTGEFENAIVVFNACSCLPSHRNCIQLLVFDVGYMQVTTYIRYAHGMIIDWKKEFDDTVAAMTKLIPGYDPYERPIILPIRSQGSNPDAEPLA